MAVRKRKAKKTRSLSHGRPLTVTNPTASLSAKATRKIIRNHHQFERALANAEKNGDQQAIDAINSQIAAQGGLESYQTASIQGQSLERGGDTSRVLVEWLKPSFPMARKAHDGGRLKVLEVGALSVTNAVSRCKDFKVERIDLNSRHPEIKKQDLMKMVVPSKDRDKFDIVSLSLVLNYVADAESRGQMLRRTRGFLRQLPVLAEEQDGETLFPCLFLVLPASCVINSRYLDEELLCDMMGSMGYKKARRKLSSKLVYYLWVYEGGSYAMTGTFSKKEINPGGARNNFCITIA